MYRSTGMGATQAQCPPTWFTQGSGCVGYQSPVEGLPPAQVYAPADAWSQYNTWHAGSQAMQAADTQRIMPQLLAYGGVAVGILILAPGGWKVLAALPAFAAYITYGFKGGL